MHHQRTRLLTAALRIAAAGSSLSLTACLTATPQPYQQTEQEIYYSEKYCRSPENKASYKDCLKEQYWAAEAAHKYFSNPACCSPPTPNVTVNINR
jgi:hypothetical protein